MTQYIDDRLNTDSSEDADEDDFEPIEDDPIAKMQLIAAAAYLVKAENITALDLRGLTIIADVFVICTGNSSIQIRAITDRIQERMREHGFRKLRMEGYRDATWVLLDYGDVVVHIMAAEQRAYYQLEAYWVSAPTLDLGLPREP